MLTLEIMNVGKFVEFKPMFIRQLRLALQKVTGAEVQIKRRNKATLLTDLGERGIDEPEMIIAKIAVSGMSSKAALLKMGQAIHEFLTTHHLSPKTFDVIIDNGLGEYHYDWTTNELRAEDEMMVLLLVE